MNYLEKKSTLKILKFTPAFVGGSWEEPSINRAF